MKNLKSKLVALLSLTILGSMLVVPSASADTTWKTLYEQNFKQAGLTKADLTAEGWTGLDKAELSSSGIKGVYPGGGTIKYTADVGSKYKLSGKMYMSYGNNGLVFAFGKSSGNLVTVNLSESKSTALSCGPKSVTFDFECGTGRQYNYTFLCDGKSVTATLSTEDGSINETKSLTLDEDITPYFEYAHKSYSDIRLQSFKLEVPSDYTEYKTTYNETFTYSGDEPYTLDKVKEDWILSDNIKATTGGLTAISPENEEGKTKNSTAYAWYNHNLGTNYKAELKFNPKYYGGTSYCFNATTGTDKWDNVNAIKNGYVISIPQDWSSDKITLYKVDNETWIKLLSGNLAFGYSGVITINVECNNGQITVTASRGDARGSVSDTVTYDATADIAANSAFASGLIGMNHGSKAWNTGTDFFKVVGFKVQQPDTDNTLSTLVTSVADDNTVTYSVKANNNGTTALEGAKVIVAAYEAGGRFLGAKMTDCTHMGQTTVSGEIPGTEGKTPAKVKAFFFDGLTNIKPLASSISKTL